ncbi:MAG: hypothetical protein KDK72_02860 [Chlamydiia bacterium]|nr:hypothetical protein [Chlamydiia bacterium]
MSFLTRLHRERYQPCLQDTVSTLNSMRPYTAQHLDEEDIADLKEKYGNEIVDAAITDTTSVIARTFIQNHKQQIKVTINARVQKSSKQEVECEQKNVVNKVSECFYVRSEESLKRIEKDVQAEFKKSNPEILFEDEQPVKVIINEIHEYFDRINAVAEIARKHSSDVSSNQNNYDAAKEFAENEWPFLGSYIIGRSTITDAVALEQEVESRVLLENVIKEIDHKDKILLRLILKSHPDKIEDHQELKKLLIEHPREISLGGSINTVSRKKTKLNKDVDAVGLSLGEEIREIHHLLQTSRLAILSTTLLNPRKSDVYNRNPLYTAGTGNDRIIMKVIENGDFYKNEIAASEMSELSGFTEITLPTKRGSFNAANYNNEGDIERKSLGVKQKTGTLLETPKKKKHARRLSNPDKVLMQGYLSNISGVQLHLDVTKKLGLEMQKRQGGLFSLRFTPPADYSREVEAFFQIESRSFQLNTINSFILGDRDANPGNFLIAKEGKRLIGIDHEDIMPKSNTSIDPMMPVAVKSTTDIRTGETNVKDTINCKMNNVCPIHNWLIGLPQAIEPFTKEVINHVLDNLSRERLEEYHSNRKTLFSKDQVQAQLERVDLVLELFKQEKEKEEVSLTPRDLYLKVVAEHPTYKLLSKEMGLAPYFVFMFLGKVPANVNSPDVQRLSKRMARHVAKAICKQVVTIAIKKKIEVTIPRKYIEDPNFAAANISTSLKQTQELQTWMEGDNDLRRLLWGEKKPVPEEEQEPESPQRLNRFDFLF